VSGPRCGHREQVETQFLKKVERIMGIAIPLP